MHRLAVPILAVLALALGATHSYAQVQQPINPTKCVACNTLVIRGTGGVQQSTPGRSQLSSLAVTWNSSSVRAVEIFDAATVPANGAVTPAYCYMISPQAGTTMGTVSFDWTVHPFQTQTGMVIAVSVDPAGCSNLTLDTATDRIDTQAISP